MDNLDLVTEGFKKLMNCKVIVLEKVVKTGKCSGSVYVPKELIGKTVRVIINNEDFSGDTERRGRADIPDEVLSGPGVLVRESSGIKHSPSS